MDFIFLVGDDDDVAASEEDLDFLAREEEEGWEVVEDAGLARPLLVLPPLDPLTRLRGEANSSSESFVDWAGLERWRFFDAPFPVLLFFFLEELLLRRARGSSSSSSKSSSSDSAREVRRFPAVRELLLLLLRTGSGSGESSIMNSSSDVSDMMDVSST